MDLELGYQSKNPTGTEFLVTEFTSDGGAIDLDATRSEASEFSYRIRPQEDGPMVYAFEINLAHPSSRKGFLSL
jgi:hypothetical protein